MKRSKLNPDIPIHTAIGLASVSIGVILPTLHNKYAIPPKTRDYRFQSGNQLPRPNLANKKSLPSVSSKLDKLFLMIGSTNSGLKGASQAACLLIHTI